MALADVVSFRAVYDQYRELISASQVVEEPTAAQIHIFAIQANRWIRRGWEWWWWPQLMETQERYFRAEWDAAAAYAEDDEIYYAGTVTGYYRALAATVAGESPDTTPASWEEITDLDAYVAYAQAGEDRIGTFCQIYPENPRGQRRPRTVLFALDGRGATITSCSVPASVWVEYRRPCPTWRGPAYDAALAYAAGVTRYYADGADAYAGDFWTTLAATTAGQNPQNTPAKWSKVELPAWLGDFAARGAYDVAMRGDAQNDRANGEEGNAWSWLYDERLKLQNAGGAVRRVGFAA